MAGCCSSQRVARGGGGRGELLTASNSWKWGALCSKKQSCPFMDGWGAAQRACAHGGGNRGELLTASSSWRWQQTKRNLGSSHLGKGLLTSQGHIATPMKSMGGVAHYGERQEGD